MKPAEQKQVPLMHIPTALQKSGHCLSSHETPCHPESHMAKPSTESTP